jgi:hypothetical protein
MSKTGPCRAPSEDANRRVPALAEQERRLPAPAKYKGAAK